MPLLLCQWCFRFAVVVNVSAFASATHSWAICLDLLCVIAPVLVVVLVLLCVILNKDMATLSFVKGGMFSAQVFSSFQGWRPFYVSYIYYYTPLPLNLANKQATTTTRLRAVLAIAPLQRLGPDSTLAILEPRWWPCQIQVLSQKLTGGGPGRWRHVGRCPPKSAQFWAKNSHFSPKTAPVRVQNSQTKANGCYTPRAA